MVIIPRIPAIDAGHVQQQHENLAALDVAQEGVSEADVVVRAVDESGNITHGQAREVRVLHDADLRMERGERIRCNLRTSARNRSQQGRLAGVWVTDEADLRHDLQLEAVVARGARLAGLGKPRRLTPGCGEVTVAKPAPATLTKHKPLTIRGQISNQLAAVCIQDRCGLGCGFVKMNFLGL